MQFTHKKNRSLYIPYAGPVLLEFPLLNKGSAFSMEERSSFNLLGLLPEVVETIEEQAERAWIQYQGFKTEIDKHITCATSRTPTKPSSIAWSATISTR
jgi:malate dehydrogenase (oxaloacetate-decarboxylating)